MLGALRQIAALTRNQYQMRNEVANAGPPDVVVICYQRLVDLDYEVGVPSSRICCPLQDTARKCDFAAGRVVLPLLARRGHRLRILVRRLRYVGGRSWRSRDLNRVQRMRPIRFEVTDRIDVRIVLTDVLDRVVNGVASTDPPVLFEPSRKPSSNRESDAGCGVRFGGQDRENGELTLYIAGLLGR